MDAGRQWPARLGCLERRRLTPGGQRGCGRPGPPRPPPGSSRGPSADFPCLSRRPGRNVGPPWQGPRGGSH
eukprot:5733692-Lingulodinium_polyedra.AAC.1